MNKEKILQKLFFFRTVPADIIYLLSKNRNVIDADVSRYREESVSSGMGCINLNYCLLFYKPFRNVFYYRTRDQHFLRVISRIFLRPLPAVEITGGMIGEGFRIDHNYCVIRPYRAGKNLTVRNGVTIGKGKAAALDPDRIYPILGDDVNIHANAVVFGGIRIGSHVQIGAGAVVNKDVPDNCTVVGNPMRIIQHRPKGVEEGQTNEGSAYGFRSGEPDA